MILGAIVVYTIDLESDELGVEDVYNEIIVKYISEFGRCYGGA